MYKDQPSCVEFYDLQKLDYNGDATLESIKHYRYLLATNPESKSWLQNTRSRTIRELNEANWNQSTHPLLESLPGDVRRARLLRLPAGGLMPLHRDETSKKDIRVICPILSSCNVENLFEVEGEQFNVYMPADGSFYNFDESVLHGVKNNSKRDRYALVFTVLNTTFEEWDASFNR